MREQKTNRWKAYLKEAAIGVLILLVVSNIINYLRAPKPESDHLVLPPVTLLDGRPLQLPKERAIALHFWGTWCPVCRAEASNIDTIAKSFSVITVAVNSGESEAVAAYMRQHGLHYPVINDPRGVLAARYKVTVFPTTFIFDRHGKLRFTETGYTTTAGLAARLKMAD